MTWLAKLWTRWHCKWYDNNGCCKGLTYVDISNPKLAFKECVHYIKCPGYLCKGCPKERMSNFDDYYRIEKQLQDYVIRLYNKRR